MSELATQQQNGIDRQPPKKMTIRQQLESQDFANAVKLVLPKHLTADRFVRVAILATTRTPKLLQCTPQSLLNSLMTLSQFGLEPDGRRAHLIPYGDQCTLIIDYKGLAELAMRSGMVSNIHADIVCDNDEFEYDRGLINKHKIDFKKPRGKPYAVYALCRFKDGSEKADVMTLEDVNAIRKRSRAGNNGPWITDYNEMAKKTVFRRLSKWLPLSPEFRDAVNADDDAPDAETFIDTRNMPTGSLDLAIEESQPVVQQTTPPAGGIPQDAGGAGEPTSAPAGETPDTGAATEEKQPGEVPNDPSLTVDDFRSFYGEMAAAKGIEADEALKLFGELKASKDLSIARMGVRTTIIKAMRMGRWDFKANQIVE